MALSIKSDEADRLARELAATTGESLTEAVIVSLRERLDRSKRQRSDLVVRRLATLADEYSALEVVDARSAEEIVGYDKDGLPA